MKWATLQRGFTIVELLIVIVVIGILAAITIVAFNGVQNRAHDTSVQSDLTALYKKMELHRAESASNQYPMPVDNAAMATYLRDNGFKLSIESYSTSVSNNALYCFSDNGNEFAFAAISKSGNRYYINGSSGSVRTYTPAWTSGHGSTCKNTDSSLNLISAGAYQARWGRSSSTWNFGT